LNRMRRELDRATAKLNNPSFIEKAPGAIVDKERARIQELQDKIPRLETQLKKFDR
jgi:valyl-tRNA synthetase